MTFQNYRLVTCFSPTSKLWSLTFTQAGPEIGSKPPPLGLPSRAATTDSQMQLQPYVMPAPLEVNAAELGLQTMLADSPVSKSDPDERMEVDLNRLSRTELEV